MLLKNLIRSCIFLLVLVTVLPAPAQVAEQTGNNFDGTWWVSFGPPPQRPMILNITRSGTFTLIDSTDGGGHFATGSSMSPVQGSWNRSGPHSAQALGLRFVYNALRKTMGVERVRFSIEFGDSFDRLTGMLQLEFMACAELPSPLGFTVPVCPNPATAPTEVQRGPGPFTAVRLPVDAPLN